MEKPGKWQNIPQENPGDGGIFIILGDNDVEARGNFMPPVKNGRPITSDYISAQLQAYGITYGIQRETIENAAMTCNIERKPLMNVLIARGEEPVNEVAAYFELNPRLNGAGEIDDKTNVDYKARSPFVIVKKDQVLAVHRPRKQGRDGRNIHGETAPHGILQPKGVAGGANTRSDEKFIYSEINGQLIETKGILNVQDFLEVKGPVGYGTGNIMFPGDVFIEGPVSDGFKIISGGSVTIKQTFDVTEARTKGDLTVVGGIIGRGKAMLKVGGAMKTKFIENCRVACRKTITVDSEIINSQVFTLDRIEMTEKGCILGGEIYSVHGIRTGNIGKTLGRATRLHLGLDFTAQQEKEKNNNLLRILQAKIKRLKEILEEAGDEGTKAKAGELLKRLEGEQQKASARVTELLGKINIDEEAFLEVHDKAAPGTLIEICQTALFVTQPLKKVRIRLDKTSGKLITEPL